MKDCIFCKLANKEIPTEVIFEDDNTFVFKSNRPVSEYHLLIIPKKHINNFLELDENILNMTKIAQKLIGDLKIGDGYKLVFNGGKYQFINHVHWHLLAGKLENENDILSKT
jgi:histidine triad (HIT) family protein